MTSKPMLIGRRGLLLGGAGLLISACSSSDPKGDKPNDSGPVIARPETGNVVSTEDAAAVAQRFNEAFDAGDLDALLKAGGPSVEDLFDFEGRWQRRLQAFKRLGFVEGEWFVGTPQGRTRNTSGGVVEFTSALVFAHRVTGCDALQVVESYRADFRKESTEAPLELLSLGEVEEFFDPSIWDVAEVDAITTDHTYIVFRDEEAARAKQYAKQIESGAKRALDLMPTPEGVSRIFYGLSWPEVEKKLWGGGANFEAAGTAHVHRFLEPDQIAKGQAEPASGKGQPRATGRVALYRSAFTTADFAEEVSCHEAVHVLANQWLAPASYAPTWVVEGLAEWGGLKPGSGRLMSRDGSRIRAGFAHFASIADGDDGDFYDDAARRSDNYACAAAVYAYIDEEMGRDEVFRVAKAFYQNATDVEVVAAYGERGMKLVSATQKWLQG